MSKRSEWAERYVQRAERKAAEPDARRPLTASQHILLLLLTLVTFGLWAPVWIVRAIQGNRPYVPPEEPVSTSAEPVAQAFAVAYESWVKEPPDARGPEPRYEDFRAAGQRDAQGQP